jgi:hypothetical protein
MASMTVVNRLVAKRAIGLSFALGVTLAGHPAWSDPSSSDKAFAEALYNDALSLLKAGSAQQACPKLEESQRLDAQLGTLLHLAACHEQIGKTATAWAEFKQALSALARVPSRDRTAFAQAHVSSLEGRLSRITITTPTGTPSASVAIDGRSLASASFGTPLPLDPGTHRVEATAPGRKPWSSDISIAEGPANVSVVIPSLEIEPGAADGSPGADARRPAATQEQRDRSRGLGLLTWTGIGLAVVGTAVGSVAGAITLSKAPALSHHCIGGACPPADHGDLVTAQASATVSTIAFGAAGIGVALAVVGLVTRGRSAPPALSSSGRTGPCAFGTWIGVCGVVR